MHGRSGARRWSCRGGSSVCKWVARWTPSSSHVKPFLLQVVRPQRGSAQTGNVGPRDIATCLQRVQARRRLPTVENKIHMSIRGTMSGIIERLDRLPHRDAVLTRIAVDVVGAHVVGTMHTPIDSFTVPIWHKRMIHSNNTRVRIGVVAERCTVQILGGFCSASFLLAKLRASTLRTLRPHA